MRQPTHAEFAELAIALVRAQAPETRLLPMAARPVADHPEYQQVNRVDRSGAALKAGWTFLVNLARSCAPSATPTNSISRTRCVAPCRSRTNGYGMFCQTVRITRTWAIWR